MNNKKLLKKFLEVFKEITPLVISNKSFIDSPEGATGKFRLLKRNFDLERRKEKGAGEFSKTIMLISKLSAALDEKDLKSFSENINHVIVFSILWKISREDKNANFK